MEENRKCAVCRKTKPVSEFTKDNRVFKMCNDCREIARRSVANHATPKLCLYCHKELIEPSRRYFCQETNADCSSRFYRMRYQIIQSFNPEIWIEELQLLKSLGQDYNIEERILLKGEKESKPEDNEPKTDEKQGFPILTS